jgi:hypothetical protein
MSQKIMLTQQNKKQQSKPYKIILYDQKPQFQTPKLQTYTPIPYDQKPQFSITRPKQIINTPSLTEKQVSVKAMESINYNPQIEGQLIPLKTQQPIQNTKTIQQPQNLVQVKTIKPPPIKTVKAKPPRIKTVKEKPQMISPQTTNVIKNQPYPITKTSFSHHPKQQITQSIKKIPVTQPQTANIVKYQLQPIKKIPVIQQLPKQQIIQPQVKIIKEIPKKPLITKEQSFIPIISREYNLNQKYSVKYAPSFIESLKNKFRYLFNPFLSISRYRELEYNRVYNPQVISDQKLTYSPSMYTEYTKNLDYEPILIKQSSQDYSPTEKEISDYSPTLVEENYPIYNYSIYGLPDTFINSFAPIFRLKIKPVTDFEINLKPKSFSFNQNYVILLNKLIDEVTR